MKLLLIAYVLFTIFIFFYIKKILQESYKNKVQNEIENTPVNTNVLLVSCLYIIKHDKPPSFYYEKMKNILVYNGPMLIYYSDENIMKKIKELRGDLPTTFIFKDIEDMYAYKYRKYNFNIQDEPWFNNYYKEHNVSLDIAIVYNEKANMLKNAVKLNPYNSEYFLWMDIGYIRTGIPPSKNWPNMKKLAKNTGDKLLVFAPFLPEKYCYGGWYNSQNGKRYKYTQHPYNLLIAGSFIAGKKDAINRYAELYYETLEKVHSKGRSTVNDQFIIAKLCCKYRDLFNIVRSKGHPLGDKDGFRYAIPYLS